MNLLVLLCVLNNLSLFCVVSGPQTIVELFFQDVARKRLSQMFARSSAAQTHTPLNWPQLITDIVTYLLQHLYPYLCQLMSVYILCI